MKISCVVEWFFHALERERIFFDPRALWAFLSLFGTFLIFFRGCSRFFRGFSRLVLFLFLGPINSTYEQQSRQGLRHNPDLSRKKWETPPVWNPPGFRFSFSQHTFPSVAHHCGYPLSRYTCRATLVAADFLDFIAFCRCSTGVALHPIKVLVSHLPPPVCREVSHRNLVV